MYSARYSVKILKKFEFFRQISEKIKSSFMKILPVGAELFHVDIQAWRN
jgi:hypothetical protein